MKNVKYWLETIPDPKIRTKALANYNSDKCLGLYRNDKYEEVSLREAIKAAFVWHKTPEGHDYWKDYTNTL